MPPRLPLRQCCSPQGMMATAAPARSLSTFRPQANEASSSKIPIPRLPTPSKSSKSDVKPSASSSGASAAASGAVAGKGKERARTNQGDELPFLPRPLGTPIPPSSIPKTWGQKKADLLDEDRHKAKRKALLKEASQGYFHDYNAARKQHGGKLWLAPHTLIREDRALYFPDISGRALTGENVHSTDLLLGKTSIVTVLNTRLSEEHAQSYTQAVLDDWEGKEGFNFVQINHQRNPLKSILLNLFTSSLKRTIPEPRWGSYMISGGEWSEIDINHPLGLENKILGYIYLVDSNLKIRWAANAMATDEESSNLRRATAVLMGRMSKSQDSTSSEAGSSDNDETGVKSGEKLEAQG